ncbi:hypothetical protein P154DRAFT_615026 [Amniculicola lignicola CBS 123094]|uniref:Phytase-like domain-containing protein n=1 Tax=Amniculicola lignicola CBS 123094 TaxID=1392246 RepID=A0A6A5WYZ9_9PLEO|nr:hypothetical protein P154DRAFT_615026 [Amniculicola lignicola CBS 123094]
MRFSTNLAVFSLAGSVIATPLEVARGAAAAVNTTKCGGKTYVYEGLAGWGLLASDARDKTGDTIGGIGSAIALDKRSWKKKGGKTEAYEGIIYGLPDRGWNTQGTQNTQSRIHKFSFTFRVVKDATVANPSKPNFEFKYLDTILLTGPDGKPTTGLNADPTGHLSYNGFPDLPVVTYTGDGFGGSTGSGGKRIPIDAEGLVLGDDGSFWVSDEYGPYVYQFNKHGKMVDAIRPPEALIPRRNGSESFDAASPPIYNPNAVVIPATPDTGRSNNQGLEALTSSPNGKYLYALLQSATIQDGGNVAANRRNTRLLKYKLKGSRTPELEAEYAVQLPVLSTGKIAAQSEIHYISETQFLVLARDSGAGHGQKSSESIYRNADVIDISKATNIVDKKYNVFNGAIATAGVLNPQIKPAEYCPWLSYNNNNELGKFNAHNGGAQDAGLLNEKWESFALGKVDDTCKTKGDGEEYYLISFSDNDFITQNGYINGGKIQFKDASGFNLDNQVLVFKVRLPKGSDPL